MAVAGYIKGRLVLIPYNYSQSFIKVTVYRDAPTVLINEPKGG